MYRAARLRALISGRTKGYALAPVNRVALYDEKVPAQGRDKFRGSWDNFVCVQAALGIDGSSLALPVSGNGALTTSMPPAYRM